MYNYLRPFCFYVLCQRRITENLFLQRSKTVQRRGGKEPSSFGSFLILRVQDWLQQFFDVKGNAAPRKGKLLRLMENLMSPRMPIGLVIAIVTILASRATGGSISRTLRAQPISKKNCHQGCVATCVDNGSLPLPRRLPPLACWLLKTAVRAR